MSSHADEQRRRNLQWRDAWQRFAAHREQTTRLLLQSVTPCPQVPERSSMGQLCVLGAGNCNDLELPLLVKQFDLVRLVDLDGDALEFGIDRQGLTKSKRLVRQVDDLTGVLHRVNSLAPSRLLAALEEVPHVSDVKHDVVASTCTFSQIIELGVRALGADSPLLAELILALRRQHLRLMVSLLKPCGVGLLITDFVSSDTCPELRGISLEELPLAAGRWIAQGNFFTGANPFAIKHFLQQEMNQMVDPASVALHKPWKWDLGPRLYAVAAIRFRRWMGPEPVPDESKE